MIKKCFKNKITITFVAAILFFSLILPPIATAQNSLFDQANSGLKDAVNQAYTGGTDDVVLNENSFLSGALVVLNYLLSFLGIFFFLILFYGGYLWMTAEGNEEKLNKAKKITRETIIGLLIVITARIVTEFALNTISRIIK